MFLFGRGGPDFPAGMPPAEPATLQKDIIFRVDFNIICVATMENTEGQHAF